MFDPRAVKTGAVSQVGGPSPSMTSQRPHRRTGVLALVVLVVVLVLAAVAVVVRAVGDDDDDSGTTAATPSVELLNRPADLDQTLEATAGSLREFWAAELPRIYDERFEDLTGGIQPKTQDSPPWTCNRGRLPTTTSGATPSTAAAGTTTTSRTTRRT